MNMRYIGLWLFITLGWAFGAWFTSSPFINPHEYADVFDAAYISGGTLLIVWLGDKR